ncbi:MAG: transglycosylase domain-containing protein [Prolixibacteraceae bacterium]|nr:transglycosylase domain-containing protein [Prolixibacteraceae bacterium]
MEAEKKNFRKYARGLWIMVGLLVVLIVVFFYFIAAGKLGFMPSFEELENPKSMVASEIISGDNELLGKFYQHENRTLVEFDDLSPNLVNALIATEDERFYKHSGIDFRGLLRVVKGVITRDTGSGGGSTISQQLAKLLFPRESNRGIRLVIRKFREWVIAVKLEKRYTKEEIITMYLNKFEFIFGAFGIEVAAKTYFNTTPDSLTLNQAALLIGMLKSPYLYNPTRYEERAIQRRNVVLKQMLKNRYINRTQFDTTKVKPIKLDFQRSGLKKGIAPYFRKYLERTMVASKPERSEYGNSNRSLQKYIEDSTAWHTDPLFGWCNKNIKPTGEPYDLYKDGLKIYTTIDSRMQEYAEEAVETHLKFLQPQLDAHVKNFNNPPFSNDLTAGQVKRLLFTEIARSGRYRTYKSKGMNEKQIMKAFEQPDTLKVYTWEGYRDTIMSPLDSIKYYLKNLSSSFMAMNPKTGEVKVWVGGSAYGFTEIDMVRSSTYKRQVGSTCKPFLYTLAMQNGMTPCKMVPNVEQTFILENGDTWTAKNSSSTQYDGKMVTLRWGLANSVNQVSAWVMKHFNPEAMREVMQRMGIYSTVPAVPSMFLGTAEITLYEMIAAYSVYANKGIYTTPLVVTRIEDNNGNVLSTFRPQRHDAVDEHTAYLMINLLQNVVSEGSGIRLRLNYDTYEEYGGFTAPFAGKTGTTQNQSDGWFVGFTPNLVAGVWTGANYRSIHFEDITRGQGANMALPVFGRFFKKIFADSTLNYTQDFEFEKPENFNIDLDCGDKMDPVQNQNDLYDDFFLN